MIDGHSVFDYPIHAVHWFHCSGGKMFWSSGHSTLTEHRHIITGIYFEWMHRPIRWWDGMQWRKFNFFSSSRWRNFLMGEEKREMNVRNTSSLISFQCCLPTNAWARGCLWNCVRCWHKPTNKALAIPIYFLPSSNRSLLCGWPGSLLLCRAPPAGRSALGSHSELGWGSSHSSVSLSRD